MKLSVDLQSVPGLTRPVRDALMAYGAKIQAYWTSAVGRKRELKATQFLAVIDEKEKFSFSDVRPGVYQLQLGLTTPPSGNLLARDLPIPQIGKTIASLSMTVEVPDFSGTRNPEPINLGTLTLTESDN